MLFHIQRIAYYLIILLGFSCTVYTFPRVDPALERLDELHDTEIYQAVLSSMNDYYKRQLSRRTRTKREDSRVCYEAVGCFDASGPFGYLETLPSKPEEIDTKFLLYPGHSRRRSGTAPAEVPFTSIKEAFQWAKSGFNKTLPTKVLIHGFGSDCNHIWIYEMRSALMAVEEVNVICVDWEKGAILPNYVKATANTRLVGKQLAMLLKGLVETNGLSLRNTHLIGFSLGAHVAGFTGSELGNLSRITGLDPAGPLFESQDPRVRLDQSDASFVDVIHSNGENLILGGLGSYQPMGHVDFYPNGGRMQKGCSNLFVGAVSDIIWSSAVEGRSLCNHRRAYKFFTDSVSPRCHFPAFPCDSYEDFLSGKCFPCTDERACGNMGYYADRSKGRGLQYLITRDEEPFCAHQYLVNIEMAPSAVPIVSYGKIQLTLIGDSGLNETFMMTRKEDEEMKLGDSISRIIVPHPILQEPVQIEILYTAYSGWLSSGLTQWRMDKVTISDSFGKTNSVCKKNLILDSGVPITLPLYPGDCNLPGNYQTSETASETTKNATKPTLFIPTPVVKIGPEILEKETSNSNHIYWKSDEINKIDEASESSRAFNTKLGRNGLREIVEPILKPHASGKNGRSHDPERNKPEITEPLLPPKPQKLVNSKKNDTKSQDSGKMSNDTKWKREDGSKSMKSKDDENPLEMLAMTVQFLPQRLARMFEQAEKYARETILPLVSTYTPKFISDIITPPKDKSKYLPLFFEEENQEPEPKLEQGKRSAESRNFNPPPEVAESTTTESTTPYTHIQKIKRKPHKNILEMELKKIDDVIESTTASVNQSVFVDLPVYDKGPEKIKYIPVSIGNDTVKPTT